MDDTNLSLPKGTVGEYSTSRCSVHDNSVSSDDIDDKFPAVMDTVNNATFQAHQVSVLLSEDYSGATDELERTLLTSTDDVNYESSETSQNGIDDKNHRPSDMDNSSEYSTSTGSAGCSTNNAVNINTDNICDNASISSIDNSVSGNVPNSTIEDWLGELLAGQGSTVIRGRIFSFLPALDLLQCRRVCVHWQSDADHELKKRCQMTWHTERYSGNSPSGGTVVWKNIKQFLRELWIPASHVLVFMTKDAWKYVSHYRNRHIDHNRANATVVEELSHYLPSDCIISGGVAKRGFVGTSSDLKIMTFRHYEIAVSVIVLSRRYHFHLVPAGFFRGEIFQLSSLRTHPVSTEAESCLYPRESSGPKLGARNTAICLGTTPYGLLSYLNSTRPHPTFFMGTRPSLHGFCFLHGSYDTEYLQSLQCLLVRGRHVDHVTMYAFNINTQLNVKTLLSEYRRYADDYQLRSRGLLALQLVAFTTSGEGSERRFHRLLRRCNRAFRIVFPSLPLFAVLDRCNSDRRELFHQLVEKARASERADREMSPEDYHEGSSDSSRNSNGNVNDYSTEAEHSYSRFRRSDSKDSDKTLETDTDMLSSHILELFRQTSDSSSDRSSKADGQFLPEAGHSDWVENPCSSTDDGDKADIKDNCNHCDKPVLKNDCNFDVESDGKNNCNRDNKSDTKISDNHDEEAGTEKRGNLVEEAVTKTNSKHNEPGMTADCRFADDPNMKTNGRFADVPDMKTNGYFADETDRKTDVCFADETDRKTEDHFADEQDLKNNRRHGDRPNGNNVDYFCAREQYNDNNELNKNNNANYDKEPDMNSNGHFADEQDMKSFHHYREELALDDVESDEEEELSDDSDDYDRINIGYDDYDDCIFHIITLCIHMTDD